MLTFFLRCLMVAAVYAGVAYGLSATGMPPAKVDLPSTLALFGAVSFFLGEYVAELPVVSHGATAKPSPPLAWKILGVILWAVALVILVLS